MFKHVLERCSFTSEDHDFEELQAELRERSKEKKASQETEKPECLCRQLILVYLARLGKPPPLPKEAPLQQLRRNLAESGPRKRIEDVFRLLLPQVGCHHGSTGTRVGT